MAGNGTGDRKPGRNEKNLFPGKLFFQFSVPLARDSNLCRSPQHQMANISLPYRMRYHAIQREMSILGSI